MAREYRAAALEDARDMADNFIDEIVAKLIEDGEASDDFLNDYPDGDSYHHETHVDKSYGLLDAATLLDELGEFEESDEGLWEGQSPREAIATQAAYTYGSAVYSMARGIIRDINRDDEIGADRGLIAEIDAIDHLLDGDDIIAIEDIPTVEATRKLLTDAGLSGAIVDNRTTLESRIRDRVRAIIKEA